MRPIQKILLVPSGRIVRYEDELLYAPLLMRLSEKIKSRIFTRSILYDGETQFYGDIPALLGRDNTFVFGVYRPNVLWKKVPEDCPYLSAIGNPLPTFFASRGELSEAMRQVDAVLISTRSGMRGRKAAECAHAHKVPVAMLDYQDYPELYGMNETDIRRSLFNGLEHKKDFDIFFKKELPLGYASEIVRPLAPVCVRPSSYTFAALSKDQSIFFSGRPRPTCQGDRLETAELLSANFPDARIELPGSQKVFMTAREYCNSFARSKIILSPSGISWDTVRHAETGLTPSALLIAPKPYIETTGPALKDGENAALYDTELREDGKYHLAKENELIDRVRYYLQNDSERERVAARWQRDVLRGHTILARSRYILESIEKIL